MNIVNVRGKQGDKFILALDSKKQIPSRHTRPDRNEKKHGEPQRKKQEKVEDALLRGTS
jgi:hypothetical protein